jgi:glycosyltransferase involved in cell wall biosynthesis
MTDEAAPHSGTIGAKSALKNATPDPVTDAVDNAHEDAKDDDRDTGDAGYAGDTEGTGDNRDNRDNDMRGIAVLMPVFNSHADAWRTIASFAESSIPCVRVLIVDDGSQPPFSSLKGTMSASYNGDGTINQAGKFGVRIDILRLDINGGIERALAAGVDALLRDPGVRYIARIDAGDLALPDRLAKQSQYLDENAGVGALGMWARAVTPDGATAFLMTPPSEPARIRQMRFAQSCFIHPAMMIRADALRKAGNYRDAYPAAEDLDLFLRIMRHYECANLPEIGLVYEINPTGISATRRRRQVQSTLRLQCAYLEVGNPYFWLGLGKNMLHLVMPYGLLYRLKRHLSQKHL